MLVPRNLKIAWHGFVRILLADAKTTQPWLCGHTSFPPPEEFSQNHALGSSDFLDASIHWGCQKMLDELEATQKLLETGWCFKHK